MVAIVTLAVIIVILAFIVLAKTEEFKHNYKDCQISKMYLCENQENCKGNPIGCRNAYKKVYRE